MIFEESSEFCKYCNKSYKNKRSCAQHEIRCKENPNRIDTSKSFNNGNRPAWNKGLTKDTDERVRKSSITLKSRYKNGTLQNSFKGRHHTEETKKILSNKRKEFLSNNPEMVPYIINHSSKMSYPEKYFIEVFNKENIDLKYHYRINKYELDFCDPNIKLDIEIDGEQHYLDKRIYQSDIERDNYLMGLGWIVIRIRWSYYQKLSLNERQNIINNIKASLA